MFKDRPPIEARSEGAVVSRDALGDIRYMRDAMARSETFTAVPGWGGAGMGCVGLVAAGVAAGRSATADWLLVWLVAAAIAAAIGAVSIVRKAQRLGVPLLGGAGRKFVLGILPAVFAGSILTMVMYQAGLADRLPGLWLLMFGLAVVTAGFASIRLVPGMGLLFMLLGVVAFVAPASWGDAMMGLGFGGLNVIFGILIGRRHGG